MWVYNNNTRNVRIPNIENIVIANDLKKEIESTRAQMETMNKRRMKNEATNPLIWESSFSEVDLVFSSDIVISSHCQPDSAAKRKTRRD